MGERINEKINAMRENLRLQLEAFVETPGEQLRGDIAWALKAYQEYVDNVKLLLD